MTSSDFFFFSLFPFFLVLFSFPLSLSPFPHLFTLAASRHYMCPLARTRRATLDGGFLSTMYSMIDVAKLSPYLWILIELAAEGPDLLACFLDFGLCFFFFAFMLRCFFCIGARWTKVVCESTHHVKMYWAWLFLRVTSAARPKGIPRAS